MKQNLFKVTGKAVSEYDFNTDWCSDCPRWRDALDDCCKNTGNWFYWHSFEICLFVWAATPDVAKMRLDPDLCFVDGPHVKLT